MMSENNNADNRRFFEKLYNDHHRMMLRCAYSVLKDYDEAEDALQQVFLNLWVCVDRIRNIDEKKLAGYLFMTTKNTCLNIVNKMKNIPVCIEELELHAHELNPEENLMKLYDKELLMAAFEKIQVNYRQVIIDKAVLHLTDEEAAKHIGIKPTYARECLCRARLAWRNSDRQLKEKSMMES